MKARILVASALLAGLAVSAGAVKVTYELDIPPGAKARQVANEMVAAIPPVVWATAALRHSIMSGETSRTVIQSQQAALGYSLQHAQDAMTSSIKVWGRAERMILDEEWD